MSGRPGGAVSQIREVGIERLGLRRVRPGRDRRSRATCARGRRRHDDRARRPGRAARPAAFGGVGVRRYRWVARRGPVHDRRHARWRSRSPSALASRSSGSSAVRARTSTRTAGGLSSRKCRGANGCRQTPRCALRSTPRVGPHVGPSSISASRYSTPVKSRSRSSAYRPVRPRSPLDKDPLL